MAVQVNAYCSGTAALELERPQLILHEGGAQAVERCQPQAEVMRSRISFLQIVACALVVLLLGVAALFSQNATASRVAQVLDGAPVSQRFVREGDTLWGIAESCGVGGVSTADTVSWIKEANGLETSAVHVGQQLLVPQGDQAK